MWDQSISVEVGEDTSYLVPWVAQPLCLSTCYKPKRYRQDRSSVRVELAVLRLTWEPTHRDVWFWREL